MGYNNNELYVDLRIFDSSLWYDPNSAAPNLNNGDNASVYLNTTSQGSSTLDQRSFRFQAQTSGYVVRSNYQQAYVGNGTTWANANISFSAVSGWRGQGFNGSPDFGWSETFQIPFASLGLSGAPTQGTLWKLAVQVHNKDDAANTPFPDKWWPDSPGALVPSSWGTLRFGFPGYQTPQASSTTGYTLRNGLNNQVVTDGMVGGAQGCGKGLSRWSQWGTQSYPGAKEVNIQNEADISDFVCFSKWYITFPLSSLPRGKSLISARVTIFQYANAGVEGQPNPSYIQVAVVNDDWNPATLSWNTAPLVQENIGSILVNTKTQTTTPLPGIASTWDVSLATEQAYAANQPLRLVFYSTDNQYNTGKYFWSSTIGDWNAQGRPTLQVTLSS